MKEQLITAEELRKKQKEYLDSLVDQQMEDIIKALNTAYTNDRKFKSFDGRISDINKKKLEEAGYIVNNKHNGTDPYYLIGW